MKDFDVEEFNKELLEYVNSNLFETNLNSCQYHQKENSFLILFFGFSLLIKVENNSFIIQIINFAENLRGKNSLEKPYPYFILDFIKKFSKKLKANFVEAHGIEKDAINFWIRNGFALDEDKRNGIFKL